MGQGYEDTNKIRELSSAGQWSARPAHTDSGNDPHAALPIPSGATHQASRSRRQVQAWSSTGEEHAEGLSEGTPERSQSCDFWREGKATLRP